VARLVITARSRRWVREAARSLTGFATSVIGCKCEAGVERELEADETPDGRPGVSILFFTMGSDDLPKRLVERLGQTVLTCPTTACFDGLSDSPDRMLVGKSLRVFGDGFQASKVLGGRRYWRIPVMEGEFLVEESFGRLRGVGGGNFLILAESADVALEAAEASVDAMHGLEGVILPFPGGVVRSGSKVGSKRYKGMIATTNDAFAPTLRAVTATQLPEGVNSVLEIVLDGVDAAAISRAMRVGIDAACIAGVRGITAGNYGGKLGPHHFHLRRIMGEDAAGAGPPQQQGGPTTAAAPHQNSAAGGTAPQSAPAATPPAGPTGPTASQ
jgi:formylmethanofuran--tetrahydromethanopterin N-formyltransferase